MTSNEDLLAKVRRVTEALKRDGKVIQAGWYAYSMMVLRPAGANEVQIAEAKKAFYAGAQHLFTSMAGVVDLTVPATEEQMRSVEAVHQELISFGVNFQDTLMPPQGSA